jgi:hypothetical protein
VGIDAIELVNDREFATVDVSVVETGEILVEVIEVEVLDELADEFDKNGGGAICVLALLY